LVRGRRRCRHLLDPQHLGRPVPVVEDSSHAGLPSYPGTAQLGIPDERTRRAPEQRGTDRTVASRVGGETVRRLIGYLIAVVAVRAGAEILHADTDYTVLASDTNPRTHTAST